MQTFFDFLLRHWMLSLVALVLIVMLIGNELSRRLQKFRTIDPSEVARKAGRDGVFLVDVREPNEWKEGHIKGARHIPLGKLDGRLDEIRKESPDEVVIYCRSGNRSATAANLLVKGGFEQVSHLGGGILAWESQNYPVSKGK